VNSVQNETAATDPAAASAAEAPEPGGDHPQARAASAEGLPALAVLDLYRSTLPGDRHRVLARRGEPGLTWRTP
jgi:hypothetical protein